MAAQKGGTTPHILMECGEDIFNLHSDQVHPKAQKQAQLLSRGSLSSSKVACIFGALLLLVAATSVGALAVSLYALRISENRETLREWDDKQLSQLEEAERNALFQVCIHVFCLSVSHSVITWLCSQLGVHVSVIQVPPPPPPFLPPPFYSSSFFHRLKA